MKSKIVGGIVVVAVIITLVAVALWGTGFGVTPYDETETEFGMWQDELYVVFEDGTEESLKLINLNRPFKVSYGGRVITKMGVRVTAAISGAEYDGAELKFESFGIRRDIRTTSGTIKKTYNSMRNDGTIQVAMGKTQQILFTEFNLDNTINANPTGYPNGIYSVRFQPLGAVKYRGYPGSGSFVTANLPPVRVANIIVAHTPTGSILVTLGSGVTT